MWDLRMTKRKISVLKGSSGSIRALHLTPSGVPQPDLSVLFCSVMF
jgi:hypothetical protein